MQSKRLGYQMAGLYHEFQLVHLKEVGYDEYWKGNSLSGAISIHDDILGYMADTLRWIETYNPARKEPHVGLCWYGPTVIRLEGAQQTQQIFQAWATLFSRGPEILNLRGWYTKDEQHPDGFYDRLVVERDTIVQHLQGIAAYAQKTITSQGQYFILHLGL